MLSVTSILERNFTPAVVKEGKRVLETIVDSHSDDLVVCAHAKVLFESLDRLIQASFLPDESINDEPLTPQEIENDNQEFLNKFSAAIYLTRARFQDQDSFKEWDSFVEQKLSVLDKGIKNFSDNYNQDDLTIFRNQFTHYSGYLSKLSDQEVLGHYVETPQSEENATTPTTMQARGDVLEDILECSCTFLAQAKSGLLLKTMNDFFQKIPVGQHRSVYSAFWNLAASLEEVDNAKIEKHLDFLEDTLGKIQMLGTDPEQKQKIIEKFLLDFVAFGVFTQPIFSEEPFNRIQDLFSRGIAEHGCKMFDWEGFIEPSSYYGLFQEVDHLIKDVFEDNDSPEYDKSQLVNIVNDVLNNSQLSGIEKTKALIEEIDEKF